MNISEKIKQAEADVHYNRVKLEWLKCKKEGKQFNIQNVK